MTTSKSPTSLLDEEARRRATTDLDTTFLVEAGAGTGKTNVLIQRLLTIVRSGRGQLDRLAAITFTEKAATELRERLYLEIDAALASAMSESERQNLREAQRQFERAHIATVHAFCADLLRERPVEACVDPDFTVLDAFAARVLRREVWREWLAQEMECSPQVLKQAFRAGVTLSHIETVRDFLLEQRDSWPFLPTLAADRLAEFVQQFVQTVERLTAASRSCTDPMDRAYGQIHELVDLLNLAQERASWERLLLSNVPLSAKAGAKANWKPATVLEEVRNLLRELAEHHEQTRALWTHNLTVQLAAWLGGYFRTYEEKKRDRGCLDFTDLLLMTRDLLKHNLQVRRYFQNRFLFLFVDEFQDTDPLQAEIVFFLAERESQATEWTAVTLQPGKLFLVGDPQQSIYRFRRADLQVYALVRELVARQGQELSLSTNFRTRAPALVWINETFAREFAAVGAEQPAYRPLTEARLENTGREVIIVPIASASEKPSREEMRQREARAVTEFLVRTVGEIGMEVWGGRAISYRDVAVLCRTHQTLEAYEDALREAGVPHRVAGGRRYTDRQEIAELRALLRAIESPSDIVALVATLRSGMFGFSDEELAAFMSEGGRLDYMHPATIMLSGAVGKRVASAFTVLQHLHQRRTQVSPATLLTELYANTHLLPVFALQGQGAQTTANLLKLIETARLLAEQNQSTLAALNRFLTSQEEAAQTSDAPFLEEQESAVRLLTIHQAKGLEFPVAILADGTYSQRHGGRTGVTDRISGRLELRVGPGALACATLGWRQAEAQEQEREAAEERRLWYVAATRARDHLVIPVLLPNEETTKNTEHWAVTDDLSLRLAAPHSPAGSESEIDGRDSKVFIYHLPVDAWQPKASVSMFALISHLKHEETTARAYQEWEQTRQATLAIGRQNASIYSVTELTADKQQHEFAAETSTARRGDRLASLRFGRAVHAALRSASLHGVSPPFVRNGGGLWDPAEQEEAVRLVTKTLASPLMERARHTAERFAETPFSLSLSGRLLEGVIDFAFIENRKWIIVDFKTDRVTTTARVARGSAYHAQLCFYALALEQLTQRPVAELILLFVRSQQIVTFPWGEEDRRMAETLVLTALVQPERDR